jgi:DNA repair exonuclease SbcCD ATPase subunit
MSETDTQYYTPLEVLREMCEQLERELAEARDQLEGAGKLMTACDSLVRELAEAREQRDTLAEALNRIANNNVQDLPETDYAYELGRMEGIAKIALTAVKGGSNE